MLCKECKYVQIKPFLMCDMTSLSLQFYVICNVRNAGIAPLLTRNCIYSCNDSNSNTVVQGSDSFCFKH